MSGQLSAEERQRVETEVQRRLDARGKCVCDYDPHSPTYGPEEYCPQHGRTYDELLWLLNDLNDEKRILTARLTSRDARLAAVEALFAGGGDFEPCDLATWSCPHTECEVANAVLAALRPDPSDLA